MLARKKSPEKMVVVDTETTGLNTWLGDRAFMFGYMYEGEEYMDEWPVDPYTREVEYGWSKEHLFVQLMEDKSIRKVFFNGKFDIRMIEESGVKVNGPVEDVMIMAKLARSNEHSYGLKYLASHYADIEKGDEADLKSAIKKLRTKAKKIGFNLADDLEGDYWLTQYAEHIMTEGLKAMKSFKGKGLEEAMSVGEAMRDLCRKYCGIDVQRTYVLYEMYLGILKELDVYHIYEEEMHDIFPAVYAIENRGMYLNVGMAKEGKVLARYLQDNTMKEIERLTWKGFNPASSKDKVEYFIKQLKLEPLKYTDIGNPQVDKYFFENYADICPAANLLREHEKAAKAETTYFGSYLDREVDNIIHANFDQTGAKTGRFSCRDPNFQFVPKRAKEGDIMLEVRRPLGPRPGCVWYAGDYSQIEARIFADAAQEEVMLTAFREGRDVYTELSETIKNTTGIECTRRDTKDIFLGKLYGLGRKKLRFKLATSSAGNHAASEEQADAVITAFDDTLPGVKGYQQDIMQRARRDGYVTNRFGQRIDVDRDEAYVGINYTIQSEAARLMKRALVKCHRFLYEELGYGWIVCTIHDELIFEFENEHRPVWVLLRLKELMEDCEGYSVPITVEFVKHVTNWLDKRECKWAQGV